MKIHLVRLLLIPVAALAVTMLPACSKRESTASNTPPPPAPAAQTPSSPAQKTEEVRALAAKAASEVDQITAAAADSAKQSADAMKTSLTATTGEVQAQAAATATTAKKELQAGLTTGTTAVADTAEALKKQAATLLEQYSSELDALKRNAAAIKGIVDQNAAMLPDSVRTKYQELNTMLPELDGLVTSLRNYQNTDVATLLEKARTDFARAQKLYGEIRALVPAGLQKAPAP